MKKKYIIGFIIIAAAFFYLIWTSFRASFQFALTPSELFNGQAEYDGKIVKVSGAVKKGSVRVEGMDYYFSVTDGNIDTNIHYKGATPNTFREGADVVVTGKFAVTSDVFEATQLLTKCASKYEAK